MKYALLLCFLFPFTSWSQTVNVTFQVDMSGRSVAPAGVRVAGDFQSEAGFGGDWNPTATAMTDANADGIYEVTVQIPAGVYEYKFLNGTTWPTAEDSLFNCGVGGNLNRVASIAGDTTLYHVFETCLANLNTHIPSWADSSVFYEVFLRSFFDSDGNGRGDFNGLAAKLDYLNDGNPSTNTDLGVNALWLMPIMPSPSYHGYDVTDYKGIESDYGTMAQFDGFLAAAHQRGIKVIIDLVLNHTSSQHSWFAQSASGASNPYRDWYVWSPTNPNYTGPWGQQVWYGRGGQFYYGLFTGSMPDLNWRNPAVKQAMWDAIRFWLNKGVDGFRLDAVKYLVETGQALENTSETFTLLQEFQDTVKAVRPDAFTIGEAWSNTNNVIPYVQNDRLSACFEFDLASSILTSVNSRSVGALRAQLNRVSNLYPTNTNGIFLTNHDQDRVMSQLGGDLKKMRLAASLYLTMPGVPFLYYGEEIGMTGSGVDENKRTPMQWNGGTRAGFTTGTPWRNVNSNYVTVNVAAQEGNSSSLLEHYRKLIAIRKGSPALQRGYTLPLGTSDGATQFGYARILDQEGILVVSNMANGVPGTRLTLPASTLLPGDYFATDLYTGQAAGTVTVNSQGGFTEWVPQMPSLDTNATWILRLSSVSGLADKITPLPFRISPNPASTEVRIVLEREFSSKTSLKVIDASGRTVAAARFREKDHTLDVSTWPAGVYFAQVRQGKQMGTLRFAVVR